MSEDVTGLKSASFEEPMRVSSSVSNLDSGLGYLDRECVAFSRYLMNQKPAAYVLDKYREAHTASNFSNRGRVEPFDQLLLTVGAWHPWLARLVDSYTSIFFKTSTIRRKWILLLAILESCAPTHIYFDLPDSSNKKVLVAKIVGKILGAFVTLVTSAVLFLPLHLIVGLYSRLFGRGR